MDDEFLDLIDNAPTADVVPKSEVEKLNNELMIWKQERFNFYQRLELHKMAREKAAREIFEEIEKIHEECIHIDPSTNIGYLLQSKFEHKLAELKKKYTKGEHDEQI